MRMENIDLEKSRAVLVTGANGQLGMEMRGVSAGGRHTFIFTDVNDIPGVETVRLDITDKEAVEKCCEENRVDVIVNCAAYTNVDGAEDDEATADLLNNKAVGNLAEVAKATGATLIHISTDYVFQGDRPLPCREDWDTNPLGVYGRTKLAGERAVAATGCKGILFRTAWLYSPFGKNFVKTMMSLASTRDAVNVVFDQVGSPTYARDLALAIMGVIDGNQLHKTGVYHFSDEGVCSWYDFAKAIVKQSGYGCDVRPCHSEEFPSKVKRPHFSVLDKTKVKETFGVRIPYWTDSLEDCINRLINKEQ